MYIFTCHSDDHDDIIGMARDMKEKYGCPYRIKACDQECCFKTATVMAQELGYKDEIKISKIEMTDLKTLKMVSNFVLVIHMRYVIDYLFNKITTGLEYQIIDTSPKNDDLYILKINASKYYHHTSVSK